MRMGFAGLSHCKFENVSLTYNRDFKQGDAKGMVHIAVPESNVPAPKATPKPKPSDTDRLEGALSHVLRVALVETYLLEKDLKHFDKDGKTAASK